MAPGGVAEAELLEVKRSALVLGLPIPHDWQAVDVAGRFRRVFGRDLVVRPLAGG